MILKNITKFKYQNIILLLIGALAVFEYAGCSKAEYKAASIDIVTETSGVRAGDITISIDDSNLTDIREIGHFIYYIDTPVPTYYAHTAVSEAGTFAITDEASYTWKNVSPGMHDFSVQIVTPDNSPLPSPVVQTVSIDVSEPAGNPSVKFQFPENNSGLAPGQIVVSVMAMNFIITEDHMGAVNRKGEGHFIYYIDEAPPTEPGAPALTETSQVSAAGSYIWKGVKSGTHTFSVQLVNNDDTPLSAPVTAGISVNVKQ